MRLDKDFKDDVKDSVRKTRYVALRTIFAIGIPVTIGLCASYGLIKMGYTRSIKKAQTNIEREVFKNTVTYTEQMATNLTKYYKEYNEAETQEDKVTIQEYVIMMYPNINVETIENQTLRQFYISCLNE